MNKLDKIIAALLISLGSLSATAQQAPLFTHYMDNTLVVNPAYAGSRDALTVTALHRSQWVDFKGAPISQTITAHTPLTNKHIGVGLSVLNDKIRPNNNTSVVADVAYILQVSEQAKLALGLCAGANFMQAKLSSLELDQQNDPSFQNNINNRVTPNFGFGAYYYKERFYAGISIPNLIENKDATNPNDNKLTQRHYFFIAGSVLKLADNLDFKPTTLVKATAAAPIQADFTASFIIANKLLVGAMYRTGDAVGALVGFNINNQFHVGYSYDWSYGLKTATYNQGSHEVLLRYDFAFFDKKQIHSPRYF